MSLLLFIIWGGARLTVCKTEKKELPASRFKVYENCICPP